LSRLAVVAPLLSAALVLIAVHPGCTTTCSDPEGDEAEDIHSGTTNRARTVYESAPWRGKYLKFRTNKSYRFFHGLRGTPAVVQAWVGFDEISLHDDGGGNISEAAGNEAIIESVTAEHVTIRNDTCETFYLRLVASDPIEDVGAGGAPSAGAGAGGNGAADGSGAGTDGGGVGGAGN
jgi:hypothetical protein